LKGASAVDVNARKVVIETIVKRALDELQKAPERSCRRLVDMALNFSDGRFQRDFFAAAQTMLEDEYSPYYDLVQDIADNVNREKLLRFGVNIGYNSCTMGAKTIREIEDTEGFNVPWCLFWQLDALRLRQNFQRCSGIIDQAEKLGIYTWQFFCSGDVSEYLRLAKEHPHCAFVLYIEPETVTMPLIYSASAVDNLMFVIRYTEETEEVCSLMRGNKLLYSVYHEYSADNAEEILNGELCARLEALHPAFVGLLPEKDCPVNIRNEIYDYILDARKKQLFQTILWEIKRDAAFIDSVISSDACSVLIDNEGMFYEGKTDQSVFLAPLKEMFRVNLAKPATFTGPSNQEG